MEDKIFPPIKGRIYKWLKDNNIQLKEFYSRTGVSDSSFKGKAASSEFGGSIIASVVNIYPSIPIRWILLGEEDKPTLDTQILSNSQSTDMMTLLINQATEIGRLQERISQLEAQINELHQGVGREIVSASELKDADVG